MFLNSIASLEAFPLIWKLFHSYDNFINQYHYDKIIVKRLYMKKLFKISSETILKFLQLINLRHSVKL